MNNLCAVRNFLYDQQNVFDFQGGNPKPFFKWKINGVEIIKRIHQNFSAINPLVNEICKPEALNHCDVLEVDINKSNNRFSYQCEIVYKVKKQKKNSTSVVLDVSYFSYFC